MLGEPHIAPLTRYASKLRRRPGVEVPEFDPLDGGVRARVLFLLEKPGPMTASAKTGRAGSGFISRNNDDPSAEATFGFMVQAGLARRFTVTWNVVPWWNGTTDVSGAEVREGAEQVRELIGLLPELRAVVFVGRKAARARRHLADAGLELFHSDHPSPIVRARWPERWRAIPQSWAAVLPIVDG